jgi:hypothetical protein
MKKLIEWFKKLFVKAEPVVEVKPKVQYIPEIRMDIRDAAKGYAEKYKDVEASGEYKRHAVLAELMKSFPEAEKRELAMAIELAMWDDHEYVL